MLCLDKEQPSEPGSAGELCPRYVIGGTAGGTASFGNSDA